MALKDQPYIPLYVTDFLSDEKLRECSAESTGVYIMLMCVLHKSEPYGSITLKAKYKKDGEGTLAFAKMLHKQLPYEVDTIRDALDELLENGVINIDGDVLYQKRMVHDGEISMKRANAGSKGGKESGKSRNEEPDDKQNESKMPSKNEAKSEQNTEIENENEYENESVSVIENTGSIEFEVMSMLPEIENTPDDGKAKKNAKQVSYSADYEQFYSLYPNKTRKKEAYGRYKARLAEGETPERILLAAQRYAAKCRREHTEINYIMQPTTFLGPNERYKEFLNDANQPRGMPVVDPNINPFEGWDSG